MKKHQWNLIHSIYWKKLEALAVLDTFRPEDVSIAKFDTWSQSRWTITQIEKQALQKDLLSKKHLNMRLEITILRPQENIENFFKSYVTRDHELTKKDRVILLMMLRSQRLTLSIPYFMPKFVHIESPGGVHVLDDFMEGEGDELFYRNLTVQYRLNQSYVWWEAKELCKDKNYDKYLQHWDNDEKSGNYCTGISLIMLNSGNVPKILHFFSGSGIISLYVGFVYISFRVFRAVFGNLSRKIIYTDMPYVDRILKLIKNIYLVREKKEFGLEEQLYAKLLFLYRSPETIIHYTRYPEAWLSSEGKI